MITVLAGGVGAARFLQGLVKVVDPAEVTVIINTGDDVVLHGLYISPDVDTVTYTLSGLADEAGGGDLRTRPGNAYRPSSAWVGRHGSTWGTRTWPSISTVRNA